VKWFALLPATLIAFAGVGCSADAERGPSGQVAFSLFQRGHWRIAIINADRSGEMTLLRGPQDEFPTFPAWSPDGTKIAYSDIEGIWVIDADGTGPRRIASWSKHEWDEARVAWSPDGRRIAYDRWPGRIFVADANGANARELGDGEMPSWSPDGRSIVYSRFRPGTRDDQLYVADVDGAATRALGPTDDEIRDPAWSPEGRAIAYVRARLPNNVETIGGPGFIHVIGSDGKGDRKLAPGGRPSWSPDGKFIVFDSFDRRRGGGSIRMINADATDPHTLWPAKGRCDCSSPAWKPR
jgi:TolB protein